MKPSEILYREHRVIEQALDCLEKIVEACAKENMLDEQSAEEAIDFLQNYADLCHHGKEEVHFFPAMEAKGFSRQAGPTGVMLHEHKLGRSYIGGMSESIEEAAAGNVIACTKFAQNAQLYINLLREHIQKEDHCLFNMANQVFDEEDQKKLLVGFKQVETGIAGDMHEKYVEVVDRLAKQWNVPSKESH